MNPIIIKNATVVTINQKKEILEDTDILITNGRIEKIGKNLQHPDAKTINADGCIAMPGFIQTHLHLCQTAFRGIAENRQLLNWLRERIWPLEAAHNPESIYYTSLVGLGELISGGTTTILDMGSVYNYDHVFRAIEDSGINALAGKALMDCGEGVPSNLIETHQHAVDESMKLYKEWNGKGSGRIRYAFAPRFILSVSDETFDAVKVLSDEYKIPVHTHACENRLEGAEIVKLKGMREFEYFDSKGLLNERFLAAHCIWTDENDLRLMQEKNVKVLHCPSSNFKLGSGMMNLKTLLDKGITASIGADGAPCNNRLDMLTEVRTTALMQNVLNGPDSIDAYRYLELATIDGARSLGIENETGSLEEGKRADIILLQKETDFANTHCDLADVATRIVFSYSSSNVSTVISNGKLLKHNGKFEAFDKDHTISKAKEEISKLLKRAEI